MRTDWDESYIRHRFVASIDLLIALWQIVFAYLFNNWTALLNIGAAFLLVWMARKTLRQGALLRANDEEEARIAQIRANWPWN